MGAENIKGPWRRASHRQIMDAEGSVVCEVWSSVGIREANANENVIAAAPELLEFAQFVLRGLETGNIRSDAILDFANAGHDEVPIVSLRSLAAIVIAKAAGVEA